MIDTQGKFVVIDNYLYFNSRDATNITSQLWKTDGTEANTQLVKGSIPSSLFAAVWNNKMYMISGADFSTYQSDGTAAGTIPMRADNTSSPIYHYSQFGSDLGLRKTLL